MENEVIFRDYNFSEAKEYISAMKVEEYLETFMPSQELSDSTIKRLRKK